MNFLGMGPMEMILIFLVAFLLLGHERMIETAKLLGKAAKEIRRISTNISQIIPERTIVGNSISKFLACAGYRLGWMLFPKELIR